MVKELKEIQAIRFELQKLHHRLIAATAMAKPLWVRRDRWQRIAVRLNKEYNVFREQLTAEQENVGIFAGRLLAIPA
jgi:hypothetical protein